MSRLSHLSFEGGGGKGVVYLGALKALEDLGVMKDVGTGAKSPIAGIAGSSAGAITAFVITLGQTSAGVANLLGNRSDFEALYEPPAIKRQRRIHENAYQISESLHFSGGGALFAPIPDAQLIRAEKQIADFPFSLGGLKGALATNLIAALPGVLAGRELDHAGLTKDQLPPGLASAALGLGTTAGVAALVRLMLLGAVSGLADDNPALKPLTSKLARSSDTLLEYLQSAFAERGLFPGFALRDLLIDQMVAYLRRTRRARGNSDEEALQMAARVSFNQLCEWTGIDLVVTGVNLANGQPGVFRADGPHHRGNCGNFPVVDAVGISSSFPFAFKPVLVTDTPGVPNGIWIDGGVLNNQPMHAFDGLVTNKLHPGMLSLRLEEVSKDRSAGAIEKKAKASALGMGGAAIGDLLGAMMYPSELGQIRTPKESAQTLCLDTGELSTLEFSPPPPLAEIYIKRAYVDTLRHFGKRPARTRLGPFWKQSAKDRTKSLKALRKQKSKRTLADVVLELG